VLTCRLRYISETAEVIQITFDTEYLHSACSDGFNFCPFRPSAPKTIRNIFYMAARVKFLLLGEMEVGKRNNRLLFLYSLLM
jgi:hypothetical protein